MSEILDFLGTFADILSNFVSGLIDIFNTSISITVSGFHFITAFITEVPKLLNLGLLDSMPSFIHFGINSLFGVILFVIVFKLFQLIKFW